MVEGRQCDQWRQTREVLAMLANTVRNPKKRRKPFTGRELCPLPDDTATRQAKKPTTDIGTVIQIYGIQPNRNKKP